MWPSMGCLLALIPMRCCPKNVLALLCWGLLAGTVQADTLDRARSAGLSGSERLRMFAYGKLLEKGNAPRAVIVQMKQTMVSQGFYYDPGGSRLIAAEAWVTPILSYDGNINGGVLQDSFTFNGFVFQADPAFHAKAGPVLGLSAGAAVRLAWANGRYVEGRALGEAVWSPDYRIGRSNAELALCSRNQVIGWTFLDLCHSGMAVKRELGTSVSQQTALALTRLYQSDSAYHELTAQFSQTQYEAWHQPSVTLSWDAVWDGAATRLSLTKAARVHGETALNNRITAAIKWPWGRRAMGLGLWYQRSDGGSFLGTQRKDEAAGISVSYEPHPGLTAQIAYMANQSSVSFFDYTQTSVNLRFDALRW